uniref:KIB1-4 beta-propeller domain-containing protein n=1 Tax=Oryza punctata TaxID=4537 RepID=A0A0E0MP59_ORYPU
MEVKQVKVTAAAAAATSSWSELPADLLGQVLLRLPSLADRVRLRTRQPAQPALPPPLPWFALRVGGLVDLDGAPVRCAEASPTTSPSASAAETPLPQLANAVLRAMNNSSSTLWATPKCRCEWTTHDEAHRMALADMKEGLYIYLFHQCITDDPKQQQIYTDTDLEYVVPRYLTECDGRLFMVMRWMRLPLHVRLGGVFDVFEADLATTPCQCGHAIFLGSGCTKFVHASKCVGGVQEDCIYFMHRTFDNPSREYFGPCVDPLGNSGPAGYASVAHQGTNYYLLFNC